MSKLTKILLTLLICSCMLISGQMQPLLVYAADDEEYTDIDVDEVDTPQVNEVEQKYEGRIDELGEKLKALDEENKRIQAGINETVGEKEKAQAEAAAIGKQLSITQAEIATLMERINYLEQDIADTELRIDRKLMDIESKQGEIDDNYEILRKRLRASYMQDTTSTLGLILGADSFADLLTRIEYVQRIAEHDRDLLAGLTSQRKDLEAQKESLEDELAKLEQFKAKVEADKSETESKKGLLAVQATKAQNEVQSLEEMERSFRADLANNKKIQDAAKVELDRIYQEIEWSKNPYAGGSMVWPIPDYRVPGSGYVSCEFGPRFGGTDNHTGIDLSGSGVFGHNIVAANDGTVVKANWSYTRGVGYGIYVMIDHGVNEKGQSVSTLYGHMSNISVQVGQVVKKGQVIGQVGSTGWSTGPHLHFEVRLNGTPVNPRPYLFG